MIIYKKELSGITEEQLDGFFVGWPDPPNNATFLKLLEGSAYIWLAIDDETDKVVGFINAVSDKVLSAYIPLLEVIPEYQGKGIGRELVEKMMESLTHLYMIDLCCDDNMVPFYDKMGMFKGNAMLKRNYDRQNGA